MLCAFLVVFVMWSLKVSLLSIVIPRYLAQSVGWRGVLCMLYVWRMGEVRFVM